MSRLQRYADYVSTLRAAGVPLASYACPYCEHVLEARIPSGDEEPYDTLTVCPHCGCLFMQWTWADGHTETKRPGGVA
ncbi:hypothetical protein [Arhodomonas sp. AD133]|uniref:hypothetical protein n=1 Tax=Arhodomonas sp. AD133 TaxID=3415009 RepID=UPI003EBBF18E